MRTEELVFPIECSKLRSLFESSQKACSFFNADSAILEEVIGDQEMAKHDSSLPVPTANNMASIKRIAELPLLDGRTKLQMAIDNQNS